MTAARKKRAAATQPKQDYHLTALVEQQHQVFPVEGVDGEQQSGTLPRPEAQRDALSPQRHIGVDERRAPAAVPAQDVELLERVGDGRGGPEAGRHLWKVKGRSDGVSAGIDVDSGSSLAASSGALSPIGLVQFNLRKNGEFLLEINKVIKNLTTFWSDSFTNL